MTPRTWAGLALLTTTRALAGEVGIRTDGPVDIYAEDCAVLSIAPVEDAPRQTEATPEPDVVLPTPARCTSSPDETSHLTPLVHDLLPTERSKAPPPELARFYQEDRRRHGGKIVGGSVLFSLSTIPLIAAAAGEGPRAYLIPVIGPWGDALVRGTRGDLSGPAAAGLVWAGLGQLTAIALLASGNSKTHKVWRKRPLHDVQLTAGPTTVGVQGRF